MRAMPAAKASARQQKQHEKDADKVTTGLKLVLDEAMETELAYVTHQLREKPAIMYTLASLLKSDSLQALLDGKTTKALTTSAAAASIKILAIRKSSKKFKHLSDQPAILTDILKTLEPGWYSARGAEHIHARTVASVSESE